MEPKPILVVRFPYTWDDATIQQYVNSITQYLNGAYFILSFKDNVTTIKFEVHSVYGTTPEQLQELQSYLTTLATP